MAVANLVSLFDPEMIVLGRRDLRAGGAAPRSDRGRGAAMGAAGQLREGGRARQRAGAEACLYGTGELAAAGGARGAAG